MIIDTYERALAYDLGPLWERVFPEFLKLAEQGDALTAGRYELAGGPDNGGAVVFVNEYDTKPWADAVYEAHYKMADVQVLLAGDEYIDVYPMRGDEKEKQSDVERDFILFEGQPEVPTVRFHLKPGLFALLLPGEAHQPCMKAESNHVRKMVIKLPVDKLKVPTA